MKPFIIAALACACCAAAACPAQAAEPAPLEVQVRELSRIVQELKLTVDAQQRELAALRARPVSPSAAPDTAAPRVGVSPLAGRWNPDIGVIADTVLALDSPKSDEEGADRLSVRELEIVFGSAVDPYSRFDATLGIADFEEMSIDEAYLTHFGLPWGLKARVGRFLPRIGKAIAIHRDSLDTVDEPLVVQRYFGHHGFNKTGADVTGTFDWPWPAVGSATVGVLEGGNGEEGTLFGDSWRRPTFYSRLSHYVDFDEAAGLELGASHLSGSRDADSEFEVHVLGFDGTWIRRYADQRHVKIQGEAFGVSRSGSFVETEDEAGDIAFDDLDDNRSLWGGYALLDWRFHPQWAAGARWDAVQLVDDDAANPENADRAYTGYLTFYQSEFARWRVQFTRVDQSDGNDDNQVFVQGVFAIGEHKHKIQ